MVALTTSPGASGRERISFRDLGVEQLGAVYESVLDYEPVVTLVPHGRQPGGRVQATAMVVNLVTQRDRRKVSGTFYTPQSMTDYMVRQTLHPLVTNATADTILSLRVLDPAMGSGAFLVAACRYLASAYEQAVRRVGPSLVHVSGATTHLAPIFLVYAAIAGVQSAANTATQRRIAIHTLGD